MNGRAVKRLWARVTIEPQAAVLPRVVVSRRWHLPLACLVLAAALAVYLDSLVHNRSSMWYMIDLQVYRWGGEATWHSPSALYTGDYKGFLPFIYPPIAAQVFSVLAHLGMPTLRFLAWSTSMAAIFISVWISWGLLGVPRGSVRVAATLSLSALALWLEPVQQTLSFGQVNLLLMVFVLGDLALSGDRRFKGIGIGFAAGFKLTPALFIGYLLLTRRYRAAAVATGTFLATVGLGFVLLPHEAKQYWGGAFNVGTRVGQGFVSNQSISGELWRLVSPQQVNLYWLPPAALIGCAGLFVASRLSAHGLELGGILVCAGTMLLVSPISWTHHYVWVVPALVLFTDRVWRMRAWWAWGCYAAAVALFFAWLMRIDGSGRYDPRAPLVPTGLIWFVPHRGVEARWNWFESIAGNYYSIIDLCLLAAAGYYYWTRVRPATPARIEVMEPTRRDTVAR
jgi:alpha-1,2-mannosyltransferase